MVFHVDRGRILQHQFTPEGFLRAYMRIARVGELEYCNLDDGTKRTEVVSPKILFNKGSIDSFKMKPITLSHPPGGRVTPQNARQYSRGLTGNTAVIDGDFLGLVSTVLDEEAIADIVSGRADQISCGYDAPTKLRSDGKYDQLLRLGNHVAAVRAGRAGEAVGFHIDSADESSWQQIRTDGEDQDFDESQIKKLLSTETLISRLINLDEIDRPVNVFVSRAKADEGTTEQINSPVDSEPPTPNKPMRQITIGGEVFSIDNDKLADSVLKLQTDSADSMTKTSDLQGRLDAADGKATGLEAQVTTLTTKLDAAETQRLDADQVSTAVSERLDAWSAVLPVLRVDSADYQPDYKLDVAEIRKLAIAKQLPHVKLDGKSTEYINAVWETIAPSLTQTERTDSSEGLRGLVTIAQTTTHVDSMDAASKKAAVAYENAWKGGDD